MREAALGAICLVAALSACLDPARLNSACTWAPEPAAPEPAAMLDLRRGADRRHLTADAQVAEALGIRYGDSFRRTQSVEERRRLREWCTDSLFRVIARTHRTSVAQVRTAAERRDIRTDLAAVLPMALVFGLVSWFIAGRVRRRYAPDGRWPVVIATIYASVVVSGLTMLVGELWSWLVESLRYRDDHLSYRAFRMFWGGYRRIGIFLCAIALFWLISYLRSRRGRRSS